MPASDIFAGKKVVVCGVPGAFTPTCDDNHLPSFIANADKFKVGGLGWTRLDPDYCCSIDLSVLVGFKVYSTAVVPPV